MSAFGRKFGALVEAERERRGWSFAQLALAAYGDDGAGGDKRKGDAQKVCIGRHKPNAATIRKYRLALDLTQDAIDACKDPGQKAGEDARTDDLTRAAADQMERLNAAGVTERSITELARTIAEDVEDLPTAWAELQNAMDIAVRVQREGATPSNHGDFVDTVLAEVARLSREGLHGKATDALAEAWAREEQETAARKARIAASAVEQAVLDRDADTAATWLVRQAEADGPVGVDALRTVFMEWYEHGRDKGLNFDLEVAIALARLIRDQAQTADQRGAAGNDLGNALATLGERDSGTARLEQAVAAYRAALQEFTYDRVPLGWAMTQANLGTALRALGERDSGTARLEQAVAAFRAALEEWTRDRVPLDWARTQANLGNALRVLGERDSGTARLEQAVAAFRAALEERTRDRVPLDWARTQANLGNALRALGERDSGTARLEQAVAAYRAALEELNCDRVPLDWARTQMNLGTALHALGARDSGTAHLDQAVAAYRAALQELPRDRVPLDWARTQMNLGTALHALGARDSGTARLEQAVAAYRAALQERTRDRVPLDWASAIGNEGIALLILADRTRDAQRARQGLDQLRAAAQVLREGGHLPWAETVERQIPSAEALLATLTRS
ncbi:MAG: hypothetical protein HLUCCA08_10700 [Rhodobacteraceae bacterium HLUCCA08]|nr:MAG: hypothetical protein HLUCCA08_10700 [Rhodobacteraceae bacterium HLUCCA08]